MRCEQPPVHYIRGNATSMLFSYISCLPPLELVSESNEAIALLELDAFATKGCIRYHARPRQSAANKVCLRMLTSQKTSTTTGREGQTS
eukprot:2599286-Amphidinium_carterae.1